MINTIAKNVSEKFLNSLSEEGLKEFEKIHEFYVKSGRKLNFKKFKSDKLEKLAYEMMKELHVVLHADSNSMLKDLWYKFKDYSSFFGLIFLNDNIAEFMSKYMSDELKAEISK